MRAAIIGYGKMGHEIEKILLERGHSIGLVIDQSNQDELNAQRLRDIDVAIEFSTPQTAYENIRTCLEAGTAVVSGTTGWTKKKGELDALCLRKGGAFFYSSNYSLGVNIFFQLNRRLAEMMNRFPNYDVSIEEIHHIQKKDSPSGTAITLAQDIISRIDGKDCWVNDSPSGKNQIPIHSLREGMVPGTHTVKYESGDDSITFTHELKSRSALALGAVIAAEFLVGKHGVFSADDLFR